MKTWQPKLFGLYASINSSGAHLSPRETTGHLLKFQSRGWHIGNFIAARGLGISLKKFWRLSSRFLIQQSVNNQVVKKNILQLCVSKTMIIVFLNIVNWIVVILVEIFKPNRLYRRIYLMTRYPLANCKKYK